MPSAPTTHIATLNGGSSSVKLAVYELPDAPSSSPPVRILEASAERIGAPGATLAGGLVGQPPASQPLGAQTHAQAAQSLIDWLAGRIEPSAVAAVCHRIVHGGPHLLSHQPITPLVLSALRAAIPLDQAHLPLEIDLITAAQRALPASLHIACFDTAFFRDLPRLAQLFPIDRKFLGSGLRRFGFHGLSYTFLSAQLARIAPFESRGRAVFAHLGAGASLAAVVDGAPVDTTMGLTPLGGIMMAARPGDLDPGLLLHLLRSESWSADQLDAFLSTKCGLLGLAGSADMRDLLARAPTDPVARQAVELFCRTAQKHIAAMAASMDGIDALIFSGGIGEHSPQIRAQICAGLSFLGAHLDDRANAAASAAQNPLISNSSSRIAIRVMKTDEEFVMAAAARAILSAPAAAP